MGVRCLKELYVELSNYCLLKCLHCSSLASPQGNTFIDISFMKKLLIEGKKLGAENLFLSGGEPLLYPEIWDLLEFAVKQDYKIRIYSSGVIDGGFGKLQAVDYHHLKKLRHYTEKVIFSLHGADAHVHDYITGKLGSFTLLQESLQRAVSLGLLCEVHVVPMSINYRQIPLIVRLAEKIGVGQVSLLRLVPQGRCVAYKEKLLIENNRKQVDEFIKIIENLNSPILKVRKGAPYRCLFFEQAGVCSAGQDKLLIGPDGSVHPCEAFKSDLATSNIKANSLQKIWETDKRINEIRGLHSEEIEVCNRCTNLAKCGGGCPGQRWVAHGRIDQGPDPLACVV
ncbi:MAG: radical SAM protein [Candidatus Methanofastidiosa archaeon]|nr:radical SAM protein [Candidatus Methanofastidiosa archaeon]NMA31982.1 radical SAM protein [Candidatus Methanofastidiosa archaeon]